MRNPTLTNKERPENLAGLGAATTLSMADAANIKGMAGGAVGFGERAREYGGGGGDVCLGAAGAGGAGFAGRYQAGVGLSAWAVLQCCRRIEKAPVAVVGSVAAKELFGGAESGWGIDHDSWGELSGDRGWWRAGAGWWLRRRGMGSSMRFIFRWGQRSDCWSGLSGQYYCVDAFDWGCGAADEGYLG